MITIIDYGLGNIRAFQNVYERLRIPVSIATSARVLKSAKKIILPGVGAFDHAMRLLSKSGMKEVLNEVVLEKHVQVLGVCIGMHIMARSSEEGLLPGLGWIDARVEKLPTESNNSRVILPHMGWNTIDVNRNHGLLHNMDAGASFYFLHSYYFYCNDSELTIASTEYSIRFASVVASENIFGVQFHPEKSHEWGVQVLKNFAEL